jgi:hypothetical protein
MEPESLIALLGAIVAAVGGFLSAVSSRGSIVDLIVGYLHPGVTGAAALPPSANPVESRLNEARRELRSQRRKATVQKMASVLLTTGQYIVGGLLASSFIQETVSKQLGGGLGVVVLVSSLFRQHLRPEAQYLGARHRAIQIASLIRQVEDLRSSGGTAGTATASDYETLRLLSEGLDAVERSELDELANLTEQTPKKTSNSRGLSDAPSASKSRAGVNKRGG